MEWPPAFSGHGRPPAIVSATPPPLLFFRCSKADKQRAFFFIWSCMRARWLQWFQDTPYGARGRFYLTHQEWRQILSGERFKRAARKQLGQVFDLRRFWQFDPSLLWEDGCTQDITPILRDQSQLDPDHFLDGNEYAFNLKRLLCYDIALTHVKYQFEETDEVFLKEKMLCKEALDERRCRRSTLFRASPTLLTAPPPWESNDFTVKAAWFEEFRTFLLDWPHVYARQPHCDVSLVDLQEPAFSREVNSILLVYYTGVIKTLNTIPTMMWTYPRNRGLDRFTNI
jgi:hypothetical protein